MCNTPVSRTEIDSPHAQCEVVRTSAPVDFVSVVLVLAMLLIGRTHK